MEIYANTGGGIGTGMQIYNNTFYGASNAAIFYGGGDGSGWSAYNNIIVAPGTNYVYWEYSNGIPTSLDYNDYFASSGTPKWQWNVYQTPQSASTLSAWQSGSGRDAHSVSTNPNFINGSGSYSVPTDFQRSSYPANGSGGTVMGAYQTGSEIIGYTTGGTSTLTPMPPVLQ